MRARAPILVLLGVLAVVAVALRDDLEPSTVHVPPPGYARVSIGWRGWGSGPSITQPFEWGWDSVVVMIKAGDTLPEAGPWYSHEYGGTLRCTEVFGDDSLVIVSGGPLGISELRSSWSDRPPLSGRFAVTSKGVLFGTNSYDGGEFFRFRILPREWTPARAPSRTVTLWVQAVDLHSPFWHPVPLYVENGHCSWWPDSNGFVRFDSLPPGRIHISAGEVIGLISYWDTVLVRPTDLHDTVFVSLPSQDSSLVRVRRMRSAGAYGYGWSAISAGPPAAVPVPMPGSVPHRRRVHLPH
jgi:hypothetical protein